MSNHTLSFDFAAPASQKSASSRDSASRNPSTSRRASKRTPSPATRAAAAPAPAAPKAERAPKKATLKAEPVPKLATVKPQAPVVKTNKIAKATAPEAAKTVAPEVAKKPAVKAKRVRAPKNLAAQYGETESADKPRVAAEILPEVPRKSRRTAKARAKRHEAMQVDDELLQRLARAGSASSLVIGEEEAPPAARRSRKWQIMCGKCRHEQSAKTAAVLCDGCGTILLREAARLED